jgi:putative component of toxin-antitoxin plasmid stabilization module
LTEGIHELRIVGKGPAYRVLFFVVPGNPGRLVVLLGCVRKGSMLKRRVKAAEIERAVARRDVWLTQTR